MHRFFITGVLLLGLTAALWTPANAVTEKDSITLGTIGDKPVKELEEFKPLADYLARHLEEFGIRHGRVKVVSSIEEMIEMIKQGEVDIYIDSPFPVRIVSKATGMKPLLRRWKNGVAEYYSVIIAPKDSGIKTVEDLKGKTLAFEEPFSSIGYFLPKAELLTQGFRLTEQKKRDEAVAPDEIGYVFSSSDYNTVLWIQMGKSDAGVINNVYFDGLPENLKENLAVIKRTENIHRHIAIYRHDLDERLTNEVKRILMEMEQTEEDKEVLKEFKQTRRFDDFPEGAGHVFDTIDPLLAVLEKGTSITPAKQKTELVIGRVSDNPQKHYERLKAIADYVTGHLKDLGITQNSIVMFKNNKDLIKALKQGEVDWVTESPFSAMLFHETTGAEMVLRRWKDGVPEYSAIFFVRKDSGIESIEDLRDKKIAFEDPGSTTSYFAPLAIFKKAGIDLVELSSVKERPPEGKVGYAFAGGEINIATWVHKGLTDAGVLSNLDWEEPDDVPDVFKKDFHIIYQSKPMPRTVELLRKNLDSSLKRRIKTILLAAHEDEAGKKALEAYNETKKFDEFNKEALEGLEEVRQLLKYIREEIE